MPRSKKDYLDEFIEDDPRLKKATEILGSDAAHIYSFDCPPIDIPFGGGVFCLEGDTKISLLDGTKRKIKDLVGEKEFWVYSCKKDGTIVPGKGHSARISGYVKDLIEIKLDNNKKVRCTLDHFFMTRKGEYVKAKDLVKYQSMMPLYLHKSTNKKMKKYLEVYDAKEKKYLYVHRLIKRYFHKKPLGNYCIHHIDGNSLNNTPENLIWMCSGKHSTLHMNEFWEKNPNFSKVLSRNLKKLWKNPKYRKKMQKICFKNMCDLNEKQWKDPQHREKMSKVSSKTMNKLWQSEDFRKNQSEKRSLHELNLSKKGQHNFQQPRIIKMVKKRIRKRNNEKINTNCGKCGLFLKKMSSFYSHKKKCHEAFLNHKIKHVKKIKLNNPIPVYDITVEKYHNFGLDIGIMTHNSGKMIESFGWESSGKSTMALECAKGFCNYWKDKGKPYGVLWLETEEALDKARAAWMGVDISKVITIECETVEDGWGVLKKYLEKSIVKKMHLFCVWDTLAAASTRDEKERGSGVKGNEGEQKAKKIRGMLRDLTIPLGKTDSTLIIVNQVYQGRNPYGAPTLQVPGGGGLKFHSSVRTQITQKELIKRILPDGEEIVDGIVSELYHIKNKLTLPKQRSKVIIMGESGVDKLYTCVKYIEDHNLVEKAGSWKTISFPQNVLNPKKKKMEYKKPKMEGIKYQSYEKLKDIIKTKYPHLKDWIDYLIYKRYTDVSPLIKMRIIKKVWEYEIMFYGSPITKLTEDEREIALLIHKKLEEEDKGKQ